MSYYGQVTKDGHLSFSEAVVRDLGAKPGDIVAVELAGGGVELRLERKEAAPIARLRSALRDYSVDKFLAERRLDWRE